MERIRDHLRQAREELGLTTRQLGAELGVVSMTISRWERGQRDPSYPDLVRWGRALGVEIDIVARDPRPDGEVDLTEAQAHALAEFAEVVGGLSDDAAADVLGIAKRLAKLGG